MCLHQKVFNACRGRGACGAVFASEGILVWMDACMCIFNKVYLGDELSHRDMAQLILIPCMGAGLC